MSGQPGRRAFSDDFLPLIEERFVRLIEDASGITFDPVKRQDLKQDLQLRMEELAEPSFSGYLERLAGDDGASELRRLINLITVNETYFFRVPEQFDLLRRVAAPALQSKKEKRIQFWSAGCSSGEEIYSILITLLDIPELADFRISALGTDINDDMLYVARRGMYSGRTLNKVSADLLQRHFEPVLGRQQVRKTLRDLAEFRYLNLLELPAQELPTDLDIIFFRNVLIYFSRDTTRRIIAELHRRLNPGGFLFLGPAETLWELSTDFDCLMFENTFIYRKKQAPGAPSKIAGCAPFASLELLVATPAPMPRSLSIPDAGVDNAPISKGRVLLEEAELMTDLGDYERARELVDEVLFLEPENRAAMVLKMIQLANLNRGQELLQLADLLAQRAPIFPEMHYLLGRFQESQGRRHEAIREYRKVLFISADFVQARGRMLRLLNAGGDADAARREARNILSQLQHGRFRSFVLHVAEPFSVDELKIYCQSLLDR
ncbi:MAG: CheR family methyltransferase [Chrysiogenia bacterium]